MHPRITDGPHIQRLHFVDLDVVINEDEDVDDVCHDLVLGLPVTSAVLIKAGPAGGHPLVRFMGSRDGLEQLLVRYTASDQDPAFVAELDRASAIDPEMQRTLAGN